MCRLHGPPPKPAQHHVQPVVPSEGKEHGGDIQLSSVLSCYFVGAQTLGSAPWGLQAHLWGTFGNLSVTK